jgi:uncharacterized damage-inducible protein DinB
MPTIVDLLSNHNAFASRRVLEACRGLSEAQWTQRFEIGPGSLHDTLRHIVGAMFRWADRIAGREVRPSIEDEQRIRPVEELLDLLERAAADLEEVVCAVRREKRIDEVMTVRFRGSDRDVSFTRGSAIIHVFTHGVHHRAQCLNMLRRLGVDPLPEIDAIDAELASR